MTYKANQNPKLQPLMVNGAPAMQAALPAGKPVTFTASWAADSVESFPVYDIVAQQLVTHREAMRVSWFASDGSFAHEVTGRDENDSATSTDNEWTPPSVKGTVHLWIVLRDSRGGTAVDHADLMITP
jgi:hypothetical protein